MIHASGEWVSSGSGNGGLVTRKDLTRMTFSQDRVVSVMGSARSTTAAVETAAALRLRCWLPLSRISHALPPPWLISPNLKEKM